MLLECTPKQNQIVLPNVANWGRMEVDYFGFFNFTWIYSCFFIKPSYEEHFEINVIYIQVGNNNWAFPFAGYNYSNI